MLSHESTNLLIYFFFPRPGGCRQQLRRSKDLRFPLRQRPARHVSKVAFRSTPIMHFFDEVSRNDKISQIIEQDCERLQCVVVFLN